MSQYALMHKNDICGSLMIDDETGSLRIYKDNGSGLSPFLGNADTRRMKHWWEGRAVPASRNMMKEVLNIRYLRLNIFSTNLSTKER